MTPEPNQPDQAFEQTRRLCAQGFTAAALFGAGINLLMLTTPLYMLQVYDRVIATRNVDTLLALSFIAVVALAVLAGLEILRSRIMVRLDTWLDRRLSGALLARCLDSTNMRRGETAQALRDLETVRQVVGGGHVIPLFDAPWIPVYLAILFFVHPLLGLFATAGGVGLCVLATLNDLLTRPLVRRAGVEASQRLSRAEAASRHVDIVAAMGLLPNLLRRWNADGADALRLHAIASDRSAVIAAAAKFLRMLLQIGILGIGAGLAIDQTVRPSVIIAASILMGRALAPAEQLIGTWRALVAAQAGYLRIKTELTRETRGGPRMTLPRPSGALSVEDLTYIPPGAAVPVIDHVSFDLRPGEALGIIGPTAAGKTTLARLLVGSLVPTAGHVRLDDADMAVWDEADRGRHVGYLPQEVGLFDGTVRENIARLGDASDEAVLAAAQLAGVHPLILRLPDGYDTVIGTGGVALSGGQRQRVGLARAALGCPSFVVLDEPNANLDVEGEQALIEAVLRLKQAGCTIVIIAHRMSILAHVDQILVLKQGQVDGLGPKDCILPDVARLSAVVGPRAAHMEGAS